MTFAGSLLWPAAYTSCFDQTHELMAVVLVTADQTHAEGAVAFSNVFIWPVDAAAQRKQALQLHCRFELKSF